MEVLVSRGLRVVLFGEVAVLHNGEPVSGLSVKPLELLCFLLLHPHRAHTREGLADLLWPDAPTTASRKYLRQSLWQLQTSLAAAAPPEDVPLLDRPTGHVRLNPDASWWCDVEVVEQAHHRCRRLPAGPMSDADAAELEHAVALCEGDLLGTWQHDWILRERDRLHVLRLDLLERLTDHYVARGAVSAGLAHGRRLLRLDPARETTHRQLMRLHSAAGDRTAALRQYHRCVEALAEEFGISPSAETVELYQRIRSDIGSLPPPAPAVPASVAERLDEIAAAVAALRSEVLQLVDLQRADGVPTGPTVVRSRPDAAVSNMVPTEWEAG
jgi:DNA-binding SARP family transcriptional activator